MMFQDEVYKLLYTTYVSSFNLPPILVPRTAGDYIKHGLKQKFPKLFSFLEVNYDEKPSVVKIFYPDEQVTSPLRRKNMYLSQWLFYIHRTNGFPSKLAKLANLEVGVHKRR
jgi:hypothetical protein